MAIIGRRGVLLGGLGLIGAGVVGYGGSLAACAMRGDQQAMLRPLYPALAGLKASHHIGTAWLLQETSGAAAEALIRETEVVSALLVPDEAGRRDRLTKLVRSEFQAGQVVLADRWVVSQTEARIAAIWVTDTV